MATAEQLNQAIDLIQGKQYADAEALLTPLLNQSATDADVWQLIALARKGQLDLAGAEEFVVVPAGAARARPGPGSGSAGA